MGDILGYYDKAGQPITFDRFAELKYDTDGNISDYARIGRDQVDGVEISTVWLGMNHAFNPGAAPVIFETMVFGGEHDLECLDHDPPLRADGESGQHLYDLPEIRADIANRDTADADTDYGHFFRNNTARFLVQHPNCHIGIRDEYGREHPVTAEGEQ